MDAKDTMSERGWLSREAYWERIRTLPDKPIPTRDQTTRPFASRFGWCIEAGREAYYLDVLDHELEGRAFDRLPKDVRVAITKSEHPFCAFSLGRQRWPKAKMLAAVDAMNAGPSAFRAWFDQQAQRS